MVQTTNQFLRLRRPGIKGQVQSSCDEKILVYNTADCTIQISCAELLTGVWDFGYLFVTDGKRREKLPGEGEGWFKSRIDAVLFALGEMRTHFDISSAQVFAIDRMISSLSNQSLF